MNFLIYHFPVSGVTTSLLLPPAVAFVISFFASMGGVSGAFLILPFQMSVLHFVSPSVSATNFVFNIVAIPSGVYLYIKERRMVWPLTWTIILGTLPGILIGYFVRVYFLPNPRGFKFFVGCVLLYLSVRLFQQVIAKTGSPWKPNHANGEKGDVRGFAVGNISISWKKTEYEFQGRRYSFGTQAMLLLSFVVGIIGGVYGVGGGAIIAPFCVAVFHLPVYTVAGASLMGTFLSSIAGVGFYSMLPGPQGLSTSPDWFLGALFGAGGLAGMYLGARLQKHMPDRFIKALIGAATLFVAQGYIRQFFVS
ncbi:MAG: sulfite exporter TauE/SafE family protein [bacterium]